VVVFAEDAGSHERRYRKWRDPRLTTEALPIGHPHDVMTVKSGHPLRDVEDLLDSGGVCRRSGAWLSSRVIALTAARAALRTASQAATNWLSGSSTRSRAAPSSAARKVLADSSNSSATSSSR
jgi:hypothetical protein